MPGSDYVAIAHLYPAVHHDELDLIERFQTLIGMAVDDNQVSELADLRGSDPIGHTENLRIDTSRLDQSIGGLVTQRLIVTELLDVGLRKVAVLAKDQIGADTDLDAGCIELARHRKNRLIGEREAARCGEVITAGRRDVLIRYQGNIRAGTLAGHHFDRLVRSR